MSKLATKQMKTKNNNKQNKLFLQKLELNNWKKESKRTYIQERVSPHGGGT